MKTRLKIHPSFFILLIIIIALGHIKQFFLLITAATIHELSHAAAAKLFGLKIDSVILTPIGEIACIDEFDSLPSLKKCIVLIAGPLANLVPSFVMLLFGAESGLIQIGFIIGGFNLLPFYPLDGGKILFAFLGNKIGILKSCEYLKILTKCGIGLMFAVGFAQTVLYPFNMSLIAIAAFFLTIYKKEREEMIFSYYRCMLSKYTRLNDGMNTKTAVYADCVAPNHICRCFTWDYYHIIHIVENGKIVKTFTEKQIFEMAAAE